MWHSHCLAYVAGLCALGPLTASAQFTRTAQLASPFNGNYLSTAGRGIVVTVVATTSGTLYWTYPGDSYFNSYAFSAGTSSFTVGGINTTDGSATFGQTFTGAAPTTTTTTQTWNAAQKTLVMQYRWASSGAYATYGLIIPVATLTATYNSNAPTYAHFNHAADALTLTQGQLVNGQSTIANNKMVELVIQNNTGQTVLTKWGNKTLELKPGVNHLRYDGPVDANGIPTVKPSDFIGTYVSNGTTSAVVATLESNGTGGTKWGPAPVVPPNAALPTNGGQVTLNTTDGITYLNNTKSGGLTTSTVLGSLYSQSGTSQAPSGGGAVISDGSTPPPAATVSNTVTNITQNITNNNTTNNSSTVITNQDGQLDPSESNVAEANALNGDDSIPTVTENVPGTELKTHIQGWKGKVEGKFGNFKDLLAVQSIPKTTVYNFDLNFGSTFGTFHKVIDFTAAPFPLIRTVILLSTTLGLGMAFMKRVTI